MLLEIGPRVAIQVGAGMGAMSDTFTARKFAWLEQCARDGKLKHSAVRVAVVLAHYLSREHGYAWPRVALIGEKSAMSRSGVHYAVNDLIARGHLDRQIGGGRKKTTRYWPRLTGQKQSTSVDSMNGKHSNGLDGFDAETVQKSRQKQSTSVDRNLLKESTEIKNLSLSPSNSEKPSQRKAPKSDPSFNEFWQHYPKKASKKAAAKAFTKALKEGASPQDIIAGATAGHEGNHRDNWFIVEKFAAAGWIFVTADNQYYYLAKVLP